MKRKRTNRRRRGQSGARRPGPTSPRIAALDALRGVAIVGMIVDHIAWVAGQPIEPGTVRIWTRLSMPLFCCLMGYLLAGKDAPPGSGRRVDRTGRGGAGARPNWARLGQIVVAAACVDAVYFPLEGQFEILVSLAAAWLLWALLRSWMVLGIVGFLLFRVDPTAGAMGWPWLDYPLSLVLPCVALGMVHRHAGGPAALTAATAMTLIVAGSQSVGWPLVPTPSSYVLIAAPAAVLLLDVAVRFPRWSIPAFEWIGRRPLVVYVGQYWLVLALRYSGWP